MTEGPPVPPGMDPSVPSPVMHFVAPAADPCGLVAAYLGALAQASCLALSHATVDGVSPRVVEVGREECARSTEAIFLRPRAQVERFFEHLELTPPYTGTGP